MSQKKFSRWWPSWISDSKDFSYFFIYKSPQYCLSSFESIALSVQEKFKTDFQDGSQPWIFDRNNFSYFRSTSHSNSSYEVWSQLAFWFRRFKIDFQDGSLGGGWVGQSGAKCHVSYVQLILAYSWARPANLVAGKGRWERFLFLLFLHFHSFSFLPCPSLSSPLSLLSLFSLSLGDNTKWPKKVDVSLNPNSIKVIIYWSINLLGLIITLQYVYKLLTWCVIGFCENSPTENQLSPICN